MSTSLSYPFHSLDFSSSTCYRRDEKHHGKAPEVYRKEKRDRENGPLQLLHGGNIGRLYVILKLGDLLLKVVETNFVILNDQSDL